MRPRALLTFTSLILFISFFLSCNAYDRQPVLHSVYFWKASPYMDTAQKNMFKRLGISHTYVRYMDITWSEALNMPVPQAELQAYFDVPFTDSLYTPVIFIDNKVFERISDTWLDTLVIKLKRKTETITNDIERNYGYSYIADTMDEVTDHISRNNGRDGENARKHRKAFMTELQIDCDWTAKTKDKYFRFLKKVKEAYPDKELSATIRLYPYKYAKKMGVPPADRGVLMCYNMGDIKEVAGNSIFSYSELAKYIGETKYPIPLDIALPVFQWYPWYRSGKLKGIVYPRELNLDTTTLLRKLGPDKYQLLKDTAIYPRYFREGDIIEREYPNRQELVTGAQLLKEELKAPGKIIFYHWDADNIKEYEPTMQAVYNKF